MNQNRMILQHLERAGSITPMEAMQEYGIMRLGARIWELRDEGYPIRREIETGKNRYGDSTHYARYYLDLP